MKKILFTLGAAGVAVALVPLFAAFEAHVINVTARIENALNVPVQSIDFGTTFPQEKFDKTFDVRLSDSFVAENRVDDIDYVLRQKPKCWNNNEQQPVFGQVTEDTNGKFVCKDPNFTILPLLCPYLSKEEITEDGRVENDGKAIPAFHGLPGPWTPATTLLYQTNGKLIKSGQDLSDTWNIDLKVPCFAGHCAQDWEQFVHGINPNVKPEDYVQPKENEHKLFGCDLWLEVGGISLPGLGCKEELDLMLVLDRSGSISDVDPDNGGLLISELQTLKNAANAFVTALVPSAGGVHIGQSSFSNTGSLDQHLTGVEADVHAAINAIASGGLTNLSEGITLATEELANGHVHERDAVPDVMVIITDGNPNEPGGTEATGKAAAEVAADAARAAGIEVFVVGVGGVDLDSAFLKDEIVNPEPPTHYFDATDFNDLQAALEALVACP
ncbi:MAG: hypothetical protein G01um101466_94 [Parcubacteria group bacterium Gr01-1014_66]|nr:MAG: hypothetical protein G01um101466_94 [Parcubacteria group bacterium Gr01-1014_66]